MTRTSTNKKTKKLIDSPRTDQPKSFVTKIWNASRFLLMNMEGYTPGEPVVGDAGRRLDVQSPGQGRQDGHRGY